MSKLIARSTGFLRDDHGVTSIEYALLGSLIAMAIFGTVVTLGESVQGMYERIAGKMP
ncbi:Flp family type IVb pilin [Cupriavidus taiwanensis]|uniref:Flp pilus assembly protein pilin Flp n=1 Tax=Cupriavidus taiwanensis TaxID=164546 RepID=A0A375BVA3_9BURK|nr:Flp family type IVb pilin [Cupriavidus taiwanensis]MDK3025231.1 Flp family type IVb pilin [Cupriavidus taiwanensis]NSX16838.1 Flp family type IVb pilin [Cupriavidus taiwanensis]SOY55047.1 Flp pilus assembly protein pilin Flp [Cupriavidus taiwanensis]